MLILIWGEVGICKIPHLSLMAIFPFPTYGKKQILPLVIFIFTTPAKPWRGEWKYYHSWLMGNLFFSIRGLAAHWEKSNPYFSSYEDYLSLFVLHSFGIHTYFQSEIRFNTNQLFMSCIVNLSLFKKNLILEKPRLTINSQ